MAVLDTSVPVFRFFEEISAIPRPSGGEGAIGDYLEAFAAARGLFCRRDEAGNVLIAAPAFILFTEAGGGPGAKHAAVIISLVAGLIVGALAQRTRMCMVGGFRDVFLFRDFRLLCGGVALFAACLVTNLILNGDVEAYLRNVTDYRPLDERE